MRWINEKAMKVKQRAWPQWGRSNWVFKLGSVARKSWLYQSKNSQHIWLDGNTSLALKCYRKAYSRPNSASARGIIWEGHLRNTSCACFRRCWTWTKQNNQWRIRWTDSRNHGFVYGTLLARAKCQNVSTSFWGWKKCLSCEFVKPQLLLGKSMKIPQLQYSPWQKSWQIGSRNSIVQTMRTERNSNVKDNVTTLCVYYQVILDFCISLQRALNFSGNK